MPVLQTRRLSDTDVETGRDSQGCTDRDSRLWSPKTGALACQCSVALPRGWGKLRGLSEQTAAAVLREESRQPTLPQAENGSNTGIATPCGQHWVLGGKAGEGRGRQRAQAPA